MQTIEEILQEKAHRPYEIPQVNWLYYKEWNRALFLHWVVPFALLRNCVPANLHLDSFDGNYYVSLVAFTMEKLRPRFFPSVSYLSDFDEINIRTYINNDGKKGVYFLNIEAGKLISAFIANAISGLPYEKAKIDRTEKSFNSINVKKGFSLNTEFEVAEVLQNKNELDKWLTERYCLYLTRNDELFRYDKHHKEWELKAVYIGLLTVNYQIGELDFSQLQPYLTHYSEGVQVIAWQSTTIK